VKATTTTAVAGADVISHSLDGEDRYGGGARGRRLSLARENDGGGGARGHRLSLRDRENDCALAASWALSREDDGDADDGTRRRCTTTRTAAEHTRHCCWPALPHDDSGGADYDVLAALPAGPCSAARAAEHTMALARLIDGNDAGKADNVVLAASSASSCLLERRFGADVVLQFCWWRMGLSGTDGSSACPQELANFPSSACHYMPAWGDAYMVKILGNGTSVLPVIDHISCALV